MPFLAALLVLLLQPPAMAADPSGGVVEAAMKLVHFCTDPRTGFDEHAAVTVVDYVTGPKQGHEHPLPKVMDATGAYYEFDTRVGFSRFLEYSFNPLIPSNLTKPSSQRYSVWSGPRGEGQGLPPGWKSVPPGGAPFIVHAMQKDCDTPDLNTGAYHQRNLKRTLILLNHRGRQVLISVSKQIDKSSVGEKGYILGNDNDWNYFYSGEQGNGLTGLGWAKSYTYDYFSVVVYAESTAPLTTMRIGALQWLRAGWSGINFVKPSHILEGLKRFARDTTLILESPRLPPPNQIVAVYQWLTTMPAGELNKKYTLLYESQRSSAIRSGKIRSSKEEEPSLAGAPKELMIGGLMVEYLKLALGKPSPLGKQFEAILRQ